MQSSLRLVPPLMAIFMRGLKFWCPACQTTNKVTFDLSNPYVEGDLTEFDVEETKTGSYIATTPRSQIKVELRLLTGHDEGKIVELADLQTKKEEEIVY